MRLFALTEIIKTSFKAVLQTLATKIMPSQHTSHKLNRVCMFQNVKKNALKVWIREQKLRIASFSLQDA